MDALDPRLSRRLFAAGLVLAPTILPTIARARPCDPPSVLFVCSAGTVKSAIARETLKQRAAQAGLAVRVASRGLEPADHVSPALAERLRADGIDPAAEPLRAFAPQDLTGPDIVIAFDEAADAPALKGARAWRTPSWNTDYAAARADLAARLDGLLGELRARPCKSG